MVQADPNKVLIVGFGYVGRCLAECLAKTAHDVYAMRRSHVEVPAHAGIRFIQGDARNISELSGLPADLGQVVCAVAPDERSEVAYRSAYPEVVAAVLGQFPRARVLLVSSTAVYGQTAGQLVDEDAPADAPQPTAQQLKRAEDMLLHPSPGKSSESAQPRHVVIRASGIYGPGRTKLIASLLNHELAAEDEGAFSSRIHRDDLVGILEFLLDQPALSGIFNASDPNPARLGELSRWVRQLLPRDKLTGSVMTRAHKDRKILPKRLLDLGYSFKFPSFIEGYRQVLQADGVL